METEEFTTSEPARRSRGFARTSLIVVAAALLLTACSDAANDAAPTREATATRIAAIATDTGATPTVDYDPIEDETLPPVVAAREDAARRLGVRPENVSVAWLQRRDWPDACLGLPGPDEVCAQVITPGYQVMVGLPLGSSYIYRTDLGRNVRLERVLPEG